MERSRYGAVYQRRFSARDPSTYACIRNPVRRVQLDDHEGQPRCGNYAKPPFVFAGRFLAYRDTYSSCGGLGVEDSEDVVVLDVRTSRNVHSAGDNEPAPFEEATLIVLTRRGAVAWSQFGAIKSMVIKNRIRTLDEGDAINPRSLRLRGSRLTWTNAGQTRTAVLR